ncbi:MAG: GNAT family N-acetyltransferase [Flavobacteriaceae bacterium]|nr:GNAT family N-acetyltransferase [Flavobacteriaceae bacterium]
MSESSFLIREIHPHDNPVVESVIKSIFHEFSLPLCGTAYEDEETPRMYESYRSANEIYYVLVEDGQVVGGAGIKPLNGEDSTICELQKMYFAPSARGKGYGKQIFNFCMEAARALGYTQCYLESASQLTVAISIYEKNGFRHLDEPMGDTGHYSCGVWMIKTL